MSWSLSLPSVFGRSRYGAAADGALEQVRQAMLDALGEPRDVEDTTVWRRVRQAQDAEALWYVRGDLMAVLAAAHGERLAQQQLAAITPRFRGLLPKALAASLR